MNSSRKLRCISCASATSALVLMATAAFGQADGERQSFELSCDGGVSGNLNDNEFQCRGANISDGRTRITAGIARTRTPDFEQSEWSFEGDIQIIVESAELRAQRAVALFESEELVSFLLEGDQVTMSDLIGERDRPVVATANTISYDYQTGDLRMLGQVSFAVGNEENETQTCDLTYNLREKSFQVGTEDCGVIVKLGRSETSELLDNQRTEP